MAAKALLTVTPLLAAYVTNAQTTAFEAIDNTLGGLKFQKVNLAASQGQMTFGIALPETETGKNDFIGQLTGTGIGWAGVALGSPGMANNLLVVAQPDASSGRIIGSTRLAQNNGYPPEYNRGVSLKTIAQESKQGYWSYTFLCDGCFNVTKFKQTSERAEIGWALNPKSSNLAKHPPGSAGSGISIPLSKSRSAKYAEIAAKARTGNAAPLPSTGAPAPPPAFAPTAVPPPAPLPLPASKPQPVSGPGVPAAVAPVPVAPQPAPASIPSPSVPRPYGAYPSDGYPPWVAGGAGAAPGFVGPPPGVTPPAWAGTGGPWAGGPPPWARPAPPGGQPRVQGSPNYPIAWGYGVTADDLGGDYDYDDDSSWPGFWAFGFRPFRGFGDHFGPRRFGNA